MTGRRLEVLTCALIWLGDLAPAPAFAESGIRVRYAGGTLPGFSQAGGSMDITDPEVLIFRSKRTTVKVSYTRINVLEYGQKVGRRYFAAAVVSPLFLLAKSRAHFLTVGYADTEGRQQAMVFQVGKGDIRTLLVGLEAKTGRKVVFQDEEARKAGKG